MAAMAHPFTYVKVLVQLGHEPLSPVVGRNLTFRRQLMYPGVMSYISHIRKTDGNMGMYRGLLPRLCANLTTSVTYQAVGHYADPSTYLEDRKSMDAKSMLAKVCDQSIKETIARGTAVIISQPFHVIALRTMAEFIGHESLYTNMFTASGEIYQQEGVMGFFAGLAPRLIAEVATIWLVNLLSQVSNNYILTEANELTDLRQYSSIIMGYVVQTITYPLSVTGTIMTVNGSRMQAGCEPFVPRYDGWYACLKDLYAKGLTSRGSSMFFRRVLRHAQAATSVSPCPVVEEVIEVVETAEKVAEATESVIETIENVAETVETVAETAEQVAETVEAVAETAEQVAETVEAVAETAEQVAETVGSVAETAEKVVDVVESALEDVASKIVDVAEPIVEAATEVVPEIVEAVEPVAESVAESVPKLVEAVSPLVEAVKDVVEPVVDLVKEQVENVTDAVTSKLETFSSDPAPAAVEVASAALEESAVQSVVETATESASKDL